MGISKAQAEQLAEIRKKLFVFETRVARAWQLDAEDGFGDKDRLETKNAHRLAEEAKQELLAALKKLEEL